MNKGNKRKADALGISYGAASNRLRKMILFSLVCRLRLNTCYQCGKEIISIDDLSVEHKEPWLQADNPVKSFFDLNNIAFSHLGCNCAAAAETNTKYKTDEERVEAQQRQRKIWSIKNPIRNRAQRDKKCYYNIPVEERQRRRRKRYLQTGK